MHHYQCRVHHHLYHHHHHRHTLPPSATTLLAVGLTLGDRLNWEDLARVGWAEVLLKIASYLAFERAWVAVSARMGGGAGGVRGGE